MRRAGATIEDRAFADLADLMAPGDLLVVNTSKVRHARLLGTRPGGGPAEVLLIHPTSEGDWLAMGKPGSALRPGKRIRLSPEVSIETIEVLPDGNRVVRFIGAAAEEVIRRFGRLPLPPYIRRDPAGEDETGYQTVYAERESSVAAPTAGLHFDEPLMRVLAAKGVELGRLELEVGPGTFKPVEAEDIGAHPMHPERYHLTESLVQSVNTTRQNGGKVWAVGTTVVRALESAARDNLMQPGSHETSLMITPGFQFRIVDRLLTNFHLPRSTLLMLVAAFAGHGLTMRAYHHAVEAGYRFYSYGDAMVIL